MGLLEPKLAERRVGGEGLGQQVDVVGRDARESEARDRRVGAQQAREQREGSEGANLLFVLEVDRVSRAHALLESVDGAEAHRALLVGEQRAPDLVTFKVAQAAVGRDVERLERRVGAQHARKHDGVAGRLRDPIERGRLLMEREHVALQIAHGRGRVE